MLTIGSFAKLSHVSVKTLRYYDRIGLLEPAFVDPYTSHRYYTMRQLARLNRILALKDLGLSLHQIGTILEGDLSRKELMGMLRLKHAELMGDMAMIQQRLQRVQARLRLIEMEGEMPEYEVVVKTVPSIRVASRRIPVPYSEAVPPLLSGAFCDTDEYVTANRAKRDGPAIAVWHSPVEARRDEDVEAALPIDRDVSGSDRIAVRELPEVTVASLIHPGDLDDFDSSYARLLAWINDHGYQITGPYREVYLRWDTEDMPKSATEIQFPVQST